MKKWNIEKSTFDEYLNSCISICENEIEFENFKRNNKYTSVCEHQHLGKEFLDTAIKEIIKKTNLHEINKKINKITENDLYGNPILIDSPIGKISIGTLRYVKNCIDIIDFFKTNEFNNIIEIGAGYGGLCKTISNFLKIKEYQIIDLNEPNQLIKKYLSKFKFDFKIEISNFENFKNDFFIKKTDLVIANYSLSELPKSLQLEYIEKIILKSEKFYIIYNHLQKNFDEDGLSCEEFCDILETKFFIKKENDIGTDIEKILYGIKK